MCHHQQNEKKNASSAVQVRRMIERMIRRMLSMVLPIGLMTSVNLETMLHRRAAEEREQFVEVTASWVVDLTTARKEKDMR